MKTPNDSHLHVLYLETYPAGSHGRVLDLIQANSRHYIEDIRLDRAHWRWLAMAAHHELADLIVSRKPNIMPDLVVVSGPLNVGALISFLPSGYRTVPWVAYFHESQWTYPAIDFDPRPYLMQHLDTISVCHESWFNSQYHLRAFWAASTSPPTDPRIRSMARHLRARMKSRCRVVCPPVFISETPPHPERPGHRQRIVWNARWELDKRPDRFVDFVDRLKETGHNHEILVLGTGNKTMDDILTDFGDQAANVVVPGHLASRGEYEQILATAKVLVSTAEHEFFGVAVLEAALAGVIPVLPGALAYPETLPSAYFYRYGDLQDLLRICARLLEHSPPQHPAIQADAGRFLPRYTVTRFDDLVSELVTRFGP